MHNECFTHSKFTRILTKVQFDKFHVSRMILEILHYSLIDPPNKMKKDLINNVPFSNKSHNDGGNEMINKPEVI